MTPIVFRKANLSDLNAIHQLAKQSGIGMTTLPKEIELLEKRLKWSCDSFANPINQPKNEYYLFVLEDMSTHQVIGTSAILSSTGQETAFFSFKITQKLHTCPSLKTQQKHDVLTLVNDNHNCSEICTLFLDPAHRHDHKGLLLSRSRFLFMAHFPERFQPSVIAEIRGVSDKLGDSPFWNALGQHFFQMPYANADYLSITSDKQFISDLMPHLPIYVTLLPKQAQAVIGKAHPDSQHALNILLDEGFKKTAYVDIFDAGPTISARLKQIKALKTSQLITVERIVNKVNSPEYILANTQMNFKSTLGHVLINQSQNNGVITQDTAQLIDVKCGDIIRVISV